MNKLIVGITGGIGSGKSTVAHIFSVLGIPVFDADKMAKNLMQSNEDLKNSIIEHFGKEAYIGPTLNTQFLANLVFSNEQALQSLNALVHPVAIEAASSWANLQTSPYCIKEAALFFESGSVIGTDYMIGVFAPEAIRIHRVMKRDSVGRDAVLLRMQRQIDENLKMRLCDFVIQNDEKHLVIPQVLQLHQYFLEKSGSQSLI